MFPITMAKEDPPLPFEVGELVETKSFMHGYRGAWFRGQITQISRRRGRVRHMLDYIDYDDKGKWAESYQAPLGRSKKRKELGRSKKRKEPGSGSKKGIERERELMLRPAYPRICRSDQLPPTISEVIVVTDRNWCVGDLVDWLEADCYWSGKVTEILGNEKARVELLPQPIGEGESYTASFHDLRPSLNWSLEDGWTLPTSEDVANPRQCAKILYPVIQTGDNQPASEGPLDDNEMVGESQSLNEEVINTPGTITRTEGDNDSDFPREFRGCVEVPLNSSKVDTLEAGIMDFEEIVNKLAWLENILKSGIPVSNAETPSWKFVEHHGSSIPK